MSTDDFRRAELARELAREFRPEALTEEYRAEFERAGLQVPDAPELSCAVVFTDTDGDPSARILRFDDVAAAVIALGYRRAEEGDEA